MIHVRQRVTELLTRSMWPVAAAVVAAQSTAVGALVLGATGRLT